MWHLWGIQVKRHWYTSRVWSPGGTNLKALKIMMPKLKDVKAYDISRDAVNRYGEEMSSETGPAFEHCDKPVSDDRQQCLYYKPLGCF